MAAAVLEVEAVTGRLGVEMQDSLGQEELLSLKEINLCLLILARTIQDQQLMYLEQRNNAKEKSISL